MILKTNSRINFMEICARNATSSYLKYSTKSLSSNTISVFFRSTQLHSRQMFSSRTVVGSTALLRYSSISLYKGSYISLSNNCRSISIRKYSSSPPYKNSNTSLFSSGAAKVGLALTTTTGVYLWYNQRSVATDSSSNQSTSTMNRVPRLSNEEVDEFLRKNQHSFPVKFFTSSLLNGKSGFFSSVLNIFSKKEIPSDDNQIPVIAVHHNQVNSNEPIEDYRSEFSTDNGLIFCVFDGHSGTECANLLSKYMGSYVASKIDNIKSTDESLRPKLVKEALKSAFVDLDNDIINGGFPVDSPDLFERHRLSLRTALAGACALVAYVEKNDIYVAWTGDSRAVLGRSRVDGSFETVTLSLDHTAANSEEYARILREHPNELYTAVSRGRILGGLMPSRAFGDSRYKWSLDTQEALAKTLRFRTMAGRNYITPPYVTAEPEVTHYSLDTTKDKFLVLATDGIYDMLSSEQVVDLTAGYLRRIGSIPANTKFDNIGHDSQIWEFKDPNAATSLIRNALSRGRPEIVPQLLAVPAPQSRRLRDDMTVTVIFLGNSSDAIPVEANPDSNDQPNGTFVPADVRLAKPKNHTLNKFVEEASRIPDSKL